MIEFNRTGEVFSENHIDPFLRFETADSWNVTIGTGTALHSDQQAFEGKQSLRMENTDPANDFKCTNSNQSTVIPRDGSYGMAIFIRKEDLGFVINGFMDIYKNAALFNNATFIIGSIIPANDITSQWVRFLVDVDMNLNKGDIITVDFTLKGLVSFPTTTTVFIGGIMLFDKERLQSSPPFYTVPSSIDEEVYDNQIKINQNNFASKFASIDSTKQYLIEGIVDVGGTTIEVPSGGIQIAGLGMDVSKLISSSAAFALFTSPVTGSGNLFSSNLSYGISGLGSQLYDIEGATGQEAIEHERVNFDLCSSLGEIVGYRQGLEVNTGRFGGQPSLMLSGTWAGGYSITTSITRDIDDTMSKALFEEGPGFIMASRLLISMNVDLGTLAPLIDFQSSNFINPSSLKLIGCEVSRNGTFNSFDTTIYPNIDQTNISSSWRGNNGLPNTFVGGKNKLTLEVITVIASTAFVDLLGTFTASNLQHFDSPVNGQLNHLGQEPLEFNVTGFFKIEGTAGHIITIRYTVWDDSESMFVPTDGITLEIISNQGPSNNFTVTYDEDIILDKNDFVKVEVSNANSANITAKLDSNFKVIER